VRNEVQQAEIKLNPPHLGPLEVRLALHHEQAHILFFAADPSVRDALEGALPRLREMLDGNGIQLNQAQVSDQSFARQQREFGGHGPRPGVWSKRAAVAPPSEDIDPNPVQPQAGRAVLGLVDQYV
jgi:flagellar hook-length control protein FliK